MNKIEIETLEKVKEFSNKELVVGCILKTFAWKYVKFLTFTDIEENSFYYLLDGVVKNWWNYEHFIKTKGKVLGQLEITAILKYISKNVWELKILLEDNILHLNNHYTTITFSWFKKERKYLWNIPNKPYNTYTLKEKTELLKILNQL